ncbi:MAG TPA: methyltransferase domain-containing protein [Arachidicoccus sp.]
MPDTQVVAKGFAPKFPWFEKVDGYIPRRNILRHITYSLNEFSGVLLDVGCCFLPYRKYIEVNSSTEKYLVLDLAVATTYKTVKPDIVWDGYNIPLADESVSSVMLTEVLEHCPYPDKILQEIYRVLKPGGKLIYSVPFIFYLHESPYDFYRYTPFAIQKMMKDAQFSLQSLEAYGNGTIAFLHTYFIWVKRSNLLKIIRFFIYLITLPFTLLILLFADKKTISEFKNHQIFTGLYGISVK